MNKFAIVFAGLATAVAAVPAAAAPNTPQWQSINARQTNLDNRINLGLKMGTLTRNEASALRNTFVGLTNLEVQYRRSGGLSRAERVDLDARFDRLSQNIRIQTEDRQQKRTYWRR